MKSKTTTKIIIILAVLALALYLLYPTYEYNLLSDAEKDRRELENQKEFMDLKGKSLNLGLDLQGGMHVVLEVDIKELLDKLAKNKDEAFTKALEETENQVSVSDEDFVTVFNEKLNQRNVKITRYFSSAENRTEDQVIGFLREQTEEAVDRSKEILSNRVDEFGVTEPIIQKQGDRRIIIELAGVKNPTRVRQLIGRTALLEFKLLKENTITGPVAEKINEFILSKISPQDTVKSETAEKDTTKTSLEDMFGIDETDSTKETAVTQEDTTINLFEENLFFLDPRDKQSLLVPMEKEQKFKEIIKMPEVEKIIYDVAGSGEFIWSAKPVINDQYYVVYFVNKNVELSGSTITDAYPQSGSANDPSSIGKFEVSLTMNDEGARIFSRVSGANIGKRLAIILDNKVFLAPTLQVKITNGRARITGLESMEEAKDIAIVLKAGALPAPVKIMEERTVGPSLGKDSINAGSYSAILGLCLVVLFMIFYYKLSGIIADLALVLNIIFIMAVMAYFHATLTMPGIAGIILTIGMAVDANVLIFERIREEQRKGKTIRASLDIGYGKAFITILDANVTTFIAGLVLYTYGSGPIQGFALTLMIGIVASMFTAIFVSRVIFDFTLEKKWMKKLSI
ncbi:MAG: protein translocase subunit SecD [Calditrichaceae bacterium]|nr:protein translocase subunit SecD [Calditrichaceae bacterium]MBN2708820.1 protein translocase subunit SecD [Calditrichaceae bacterium]RQV97651.1 MAG: protein translocase subunit SecD [Calditrichota bacterium]